MEEKNLASDPLRLRRRLLFVGLAVLTVLFGAVVFFKSVLLKRPQGDLALTRPARS